MLWGFASSSPAALAGAARGDTAWQDCTVCAEGGEKVCVASKERMVCALTEIHSIRHLRGGSPLLQYPQHGDALCIWPYADAAQIPDRGRHLTTFARKEAWGKGPGSMADRGMPSFAKHHTGSQMDPHRGHLAAFSPGEAQPLYRLGSQ